MSDGQRSGKSTGRVSCKSTQLKRCSMIEMHWNIIIIKDIHIAQVREGHKCAMSAEMAVWLRNCLCLYSYLHNVMWMLSLTLAACAAELTGAERGAWRRPRDRRPGEWQGTSQESAEKTTDRLDIQCHRGRTGRHSHRR